MPQQLLAPTPNRAPSSLLDGHVSLLLTCQPDVPGEPQAPQKPSERHPRSQGNHTSTGQRCRQDPGCLSDTCGWFATGLHADTQPTLRGVLLVRRSKLYSCTCVHAFRSAMCGLTSIFSRWIRISVRTLLPMCHAQIMMCPAGTALTFSQMCFITLHSFPSFLQWDRSCIPRLQRRHVPIRQWIAQVLVLTSSSLLNNWAFAFHVPLTVQIVFRSAGKLLFLVGTREKWDGRLGTSSHTGSSMKHTHATCILSMY